VKLVEARPDDLHDRSDLGATFHGLALAEAGLGRPGKAVAACQQAVAHQEAAFEKAPQVPRYRAFLDDHYALLARLQRELGRPSEAAATARKRQQLGTGRHGPLPRASPRGFHPLKRRQR
jgi:hypothetical protein